MHLSLADAVLYDAICGCCCCVCDVYILGKHSCRRLFLSVCFYNICVYRGLYVTLRLWQLVCDISWCLSVTVAVAIVTM